MSRGRTTHSMEAAVEYLRGQQEIEGIAILNKFTKQPKDRKCVTSTTRRYSSTWNCVNDVLTVLERQSRLAES